MLQLVPPKPAPLSSYNELPVNVGPIPELEKLGEDRGKTSLLKECGIEFFASLWLNHVVSMTEDRSHFDVEVHYLTHRK